MTISRTLTNKSMLIYTVNIKAIVNILSRFCTVTEIRQKIPPLFPVAALLVSLFLSLLITTSASAQSYGPDVTTTSGAIDCGHGGSDTADKAFDDNSATSWVSSQTGTAVAGFACVGQDFGSNSYHVQRLSIQQYVTAANDVTSVIVQNSTVAGCGSGWNTVDTINSLPQDNVKRFYNITSSQSAECWRLLANSTLGAGLGWRNVEIEMMELMSWPTNTPGPTDTPTITPTASTTPSPTPNYFVEITSTAGSPMRLERSATYGDMATFTGLCGTWLLLFVVFSYMYWVKKQ